MGVYEQYQAVRAQVDDACVACGRDPRAVLLVAVSKTVGGEEVREAIGGGAADFGENRPDELLRKSAVLPAMRWHFIGNLQSRRIPDIVGRACLMHSVFKLDHLPKIEKAAAALGITQDILLEVNSGEQNKGGIEPSQAPSFVEQALSLAHVRIRGLMTMAPQGDTEAARDCFARLRGLREQLERDVAGPGALPELSMGMSEDWPAAIAEGATIVRIGRAIFQ